ncbi:MAG: hypothetical protein VR69_09020 [Peptococcaceae bacterium BRH_c4b]|nr:MAG: hypothetical protein VR69_09020 [Peptococcaceae bacterium BRH_c4b]
MPGVKREPGVNPGRSGHCKWGVAPNATGSLKAREGGGYAKSHESGDLPERRLSIAFREKARCSQGIDSKGVIPFGKTRLLRKSRVFYILTALLHP